MFSYLFCHVGRHMISIVFSKQCRKPFLIIYWMITKARSGYFTEVKFEIFTTYTVRFVE